MKREESVVGGRRGGGGGAGVNWDWYYWLSQVHHNVPIK